MFDLENKYQFGNKYKNIIMVVILVVITLITSCGISDTALSKQEIEVAKEILGNDTRLSEMNEELEDYRSLDVETSVKKLYVSDNSRYVFYCSPIGRNGPIDIMLIINGLTDRTESMKIISHSETEHYVKDMESDWFTGRFFDKDVTTDLERVKLEAERDNDIVAITGSTITTDAVIQGVNDAFAAYRSLISSAEEEPIGVIILKNESEEVLGEVTLRELKTLDSYRRKMTVNTSQGDIKHDFRGVWLSEAISLVDDALLTKYKSIDVIGSDGYSAEISIDEVLKENNVFIMYEDNGEPMQTESGEAGGYRLVILKDEFGQRFTNLITELRFK